ncbi:MAG: membrane protein insertion efficiency factor YidD [Dehalococcoidia bacterium]|nr:MAG: membrane protein insertion efficiency factor YidD [Dehalococcoidia bacterium]
MALLTSSTSDAPASNLSVGQRAALRLIRGYQVAISPNLGTKCRYAPSCSHYAAEAIEVHGLGRGIWLAARRLLRCRPGGGSGFDSVPPRRDGRAS